MSTDHNNCGFLKLVLQVVTSCSAERTPASYTLKIEAIHSSVTFGNQTLEHALPDLGTIDYPDLLDEAIAVSTFCFS
jgi:hypothetical protein